MWTLFIISSRGRKIPHWTDDARGVVFMAQGLLISNPDIKFKFEKV